VIARYRANERAEEEREFLHSSWDFRLNTDGQTACGENQSQLKAGSVTQLY